MPKRKSQFMRALEERRDEARRERLRAEARQGEEDADEPRPSEDKVLVERPPALWPTRPARRPWK